MTQNKVTIGGVSIPPNSHKQVHIRLPRLYDYTEMTIPVKVVRGKKEGHRLFVSAAIHGDEINGVETIKRLLHHPDIESTQDMCGTLIVVPIVNVFGYNNKSRYLPDRRDLNRCFPGHPQGPLASQLAYTFMEEIVKKSTHGIDLHTGAINRTNIPQIRACLEQDETNKLAQVFNAPVIIDAQLRDGSLREAARELDMPILLFEGGEALRFDDYAIDTALRGILNVMHEIGMIKTKHERDKNTSIFTARTSHWVRAPQSGSLQSFVKVGDTVKKKQILGVISDPFGYHATRVDSPLNGIVIGATTLPLINTGDASFHIATFEDLKDYEQYIDQRYGPISKVT